MRRVHEVTVPRAAPPGPNRGRHWLGPEFARRRPVRAGSATACDANRYRKHFGSCGHACLLLFQGLAGSPGLRQS